MSGASQQPVHILTLKWGTLYGPRYANRLQKAVSRHLTLPHQFHCFTDDSSGLSPEIKTHPLPDLEGLPDRLNPSTWLKLTLFADNLAEGLTGPSLFLDLDLLVTGNIDCFFSYEPDKIAIIHNWLTPWKTILRRRPEIGNSSVFRFNSGATQHVLDQYHSEREYALANFHPPQTYLTHCIRERMVFWPEDWVRSFKRHCRPLFPFNHFVAPRFPKEARMIAFHGKPDPHTALEGYRGKKPHHAVKPTIWVQDHWID